MLFICLQYSKETSSSQTSCSANKILHFICIWSFLSSFEFKWKLQFFFHSACCPITWFFYLTWTASNPSLSKQGKLCLSSNHPCQWPARNCRENAISGLSVNPAPWHCLYTWGESVNIQKKKLKDKLLQFIWQCLNVHSFRSYIIMMKLWKKTSKRENMLLLFTELLVL